MLIYSDTTGLTCHKTYFDFSALEILCMKKEISLNSVFLRKLQVLPEFLNAIKSSFIRNFRMHSTFIEESNIQVTCYFWNFQSEIFAKDEPHKRYLCEKCQQVFEQGQINFSFRFSPLVLPIKKKENWSQFIDKKFSIQIV